MSDSWASSPGSRKSMLANRGRDTQPELALRRALFARGLRYRVDFAPLKGLRRRADVVFTRAKVAVFLDGCFWHGCPLHYSAPQANSEFWRDKISANKNRDRDTDQRLGEAGWLVIRVWEHVDIDDAAADIELVVRSRR